MTASDGLSERQRDFVDRLDQLLEAVDVHRPEVPLPKETPIRELRRTRRGAVEDNVGVITLSEVDGVLVWEDEDDATVQSGRRLAGRRGLPRRGELIAQYKFEKLAPSKIGEYLEALDRTLTPQQGLLALGKDGTLQPVERPLAGRRILLFVHGAFSNSNHLVDELRATAGGVAFLNRAAAHYNQVLAFNHPTLSVSPVLNALDLKRLFQEAKAQVDVVCHSRGGLVARWWCEVLSGGCVPRRVVFVGAPLAGTSLAAASRLREALNLLTNIGHALSLAADTASAAVPFLTVAGGLIRMITSISGVLGKAPIVDAAVALFPGLASMSRVGNNAELLRLRASGVMPACEYFAVKSNFEPTDPGWAFWRYFTKVKERAAEAVANIIFDGPNDLVVDTDSMGELAENLSIPAGRIYDFGTTDRVHHANYFRQDAALDFIAKSLGVPK